MNINLIIILFLGLFSFTLYADDLKLNLIDLSDFEDISKEIQANFTHTTVSSAGTRSEILAVDVGLVGGITKSERIEALAKEVDPNISYGFIPHAALLAAVTVPKGFTGEATFMPKKSFSGVSYQSKSFALKWKISRLWKGFIDNAVRVHYSNNVLSYDQTINNYSTGNNPVDSSIKFSNSTTGISYMISKNFYIVEPWIGAGFVKGKTQLDIDASGTATIFDQTVDRSESRSAVVKNNGVHYFAGVKVNLLLLTLAVEYSKLFGVDKFSARTVMSF